MAEVLVDDDPVEELGVLDVDRPVGAEELGGALDVRGGGGLSGHELGRIGRNEEEEDVGDERDGDEEHARPEEPSCEVPQHR